MAARQSVWARSMPVKEHSRLFGDYCRMRNRSNGFLLRPSFFPV